MRGPGGSGRPNGATGRGRRGSSGNRKCGQGWAEEYPRPHPPPPFVSGVRQSQLVRKPGTMEAERGGVRGVANVDRGGESNGYQAAPPVPPMNPHYGGGILQSQLTKNPGGNKFELPRSSSSPDGVDNFSFKPLPSLQQQVSREEPQKEDGFAGELGGGPGGCGQSSYPVSPSKSLSSTQRPVDKDSSACRGLTEEQIKNEVRWQSSAIERAVKKVRLCCTAVCR